MSNSEEYKQLKTLYHEERYEVLEVEIHLSNDDEDEGRIIFDTGEGETEIIGHSSDFIMALFSMKSIPAEDGDRFIDLSTTPAGDPDGY